MSYTTKVIYSTDSNFTNTQNVTESGKPDSIELENLISNQNYYTKAELEDNNGTLLDTSDILTFQTLAAGTISLTYVSTTRSGNNYIASFTYTSTYALSSAIMLIKSVNVQGVIEGNNITFTISGLTHGDAYLYNITATDIYTETGTLSGSITTTVVNEVAITSTVAAETSMRLNLSYQTDSGFRSGCGECWVMGDDPDTDQPESYAFFNEGDTYVVVPDINADTQYQFRATIELQDNTEVYSSVVVVRTTTHDYSQDYFTIENLANRSNTITLKTKGNAPNNTVYYSTNNGSTWTSIVLDTTGYQIVMSANDKVQLKGDNIRYVGNSPTANNNTTIICSDDFKMYGNIASLLSSTNFVNVTSIPEYWQTGMFSENTHLLDASGLYFPDEIGVFGCVAMFSGCTALRTPPTMSNVTTLNDVSLTNMFYGCTSLTTPPDLSKITRVGRQGMMNIFRDCTSLTTMPDLSNVVSVGNNGMENIFYGCVSLVNVIDFDSLTTVGDYGFQNAFGSCDNLEIAPNFNSVTTVGAHTFDQLFTWCGNLKSASEFDSLTTVSEYVFSAAYYNCTSLKTGSDIRRITAAGGSAFNSMYEGCSSLSTAFAPTITWDTSKTSNWLKGVAASGTLYADSSIASSIPTSNVSGCPIGWTVETAMLLQSPSITFDRGNVVLTATIPQDSNAYIRYKKNDDTNWIEYLTPISVAPNDIIYAQNYTETSGYTPSTVVSETFATMQLNAPVITYDASTEYVTISDTNDDFAKSEIYYTTDGTTPTSSSKLYETPFQEHVGVTVKAIVIPNNTTWYTNSNVASTVLSVIKKLSYIHNESMSSGPSDAQPDETYAINTEIVMDNTIKFRYVGKYVGYTTGNVIVGNFTGNDINDLRMFSPFGNTLFFDWGALRKNISYTFSNVDDIDITGGNYYLYDNGASNYIINESQAGYSANETLVVDCSSFWLKSLQIWKTIDNVETLVFDGSAAEHEGKCGLWDEVSQKLFTNDNITIVGED